MPWPIQRWVSVVMLVASLGAIVFAQPARTEDLHPYLSKKHRLIVGGFWQESEASLTAAREPLDPTAVNLEAMGLKHRDTTWMVEYRFRKNPRWQYSASLYRYS